MAKLNWDKARTESIARRHGSERIWDESGRCFGDRVVKKRHSAGKVKERLNRTVECLPKMSASQSLPLSTLNSDTAECPQCGVRVRLKKLNRHHRKAHPKFHNASKKTDKSSQIPQSVSLYQEQRVRISDLARLIGVLPVVLVQRARLKGADVELPYDTISSEMAEEIRASFIERAAPRRRRF